MLIKKKINGTYYCAIATTDGKWDRVWVSTSFINKKEGLTQILHAEISTLGFTSETPLASRPSDSSISQPPPSVNTEDKKSLKFSLGSNSEQSEAGQKAKKDKPVDVVGQKAGDAYKEIDAWVNEVFSGDYSDGSSDDAGLSSTAKWTIRKGIAEAFSSVDRTATARKLAENILESVMITKYADPETFDRYTRIYEVLG